MCDWTVGTARSTTAGRVGSGEVFLFSTDTQIITVAQTSQLLHRWTINTAGWGEMPIKEHAQGQGARWRGRGACWNVEEFGDGGRWWDVWCCVSTKTAVRWEDEWFFFLKCLTSVLCQLFSAQHSCTDIYMQTKPFAGPLPGSSVSLFPLTCLSFLPLCSSPLLEWNNFGANVLEGCRM